MNEIILRGVLTKHPDIRYTRTGVLTATLHLEVKKEILGMAIRTETSYPTIKFVGKMAETVLKELTSGDAIEVSAYIRTEEKTTRNDYTYTEYTIIGESYEVVNLAEIKSA